MTRGRSPLVVALALALACSKAREDDPRATLTFVDEGRAPTTISLRTLTQRIQADEVRGYDPYYKKDKRFRALPLSRVLALGFPERRSLADAELVFRATDGYAAYLRGALATEDGAYVAFEDLDVAAWEPIGPQRANPGPFYLVWSKPEQVDLETHPRPWQLAKIEIVRFEVAYPNTRPPGERAPDDPAMRGYAIFRERCFKCHAVNREGGRVGPDLNVPRNILEYRPEEQVRAYIRDPATFRYGNMPPHPDLADASLDALIAYLGAMKDRKHDPKD
ncbi:MAG: cytochrome c [Labilithrix sp.]|nr:cytochrome c [Labilithrix sp.]MCW5833105.1 cytochrome c [Labilithrix sp.]